MRKYIIGCGMLALLIGACTNNETKTKETQDSSVVNVPTEVLTTDVNLTEVITRFVRAYASQDNGKANNLIHPDLGFTVIYRPGVADTFEKVDSINFQHPIPSHFAYPTISNDYALTFESLPSYDCGTEKWDKEGFFCDTTAHPRQLSNIIAFENEFDEDKVSEDELLKIEQYEANSFRIIVTTRIPLVFHVQRYKGGWYVTTLDRAYASCES